MIRLTHRRAVNLVSSIIGIEALAVMAGWISGVDTLTNIAPVVRNMPFITAALFLLSALGLYCMSRVIRDEDELARLVLPGISLIIFLVTVTLFVGKLLGTPTGIENLFSQQLPSGPSIGSLQTSEGLSFTCMVNFIIFGVAGIASLFPEFSRKKLLIYFGITLIMFGSVALAGYLFNMPVLYYELSISSVGMSLSCALSFILLGLGLTQVQRSEKNQ